MLPLLSRHDLEEILRNEKGITIGSHGVSHCRLSNISKTNLIKEIHHSKNELEHLFGVLFHIKSIAYPHGGRLEYDERAIKEVQNAGYTLALIWIWRFNYEIDRWQLKRIVINEQDDLKRFEKKIDGSYDWICFKEEIAYKVKMARNSILNLGKKKERYYN